MFASEMLTLMFRAVRGLPVYFFINKQHHQNRLPLLTSISRSKPGSRRPVLHSYRSPETLVRYGGYHAHRARLLKVLIVPFEEAVAHSFYENSGRCRLLRSHWRAYKGPAFSFTLRREKAVSDINGDRLGTTARIRLSPQ